MKRIGLTGGIGSGKSTVAQLLAREGFPIIDADAVAREIVQPGEPALAELVEVFGEGIIRADGTLDRAALAAVAFADEPSTARLNRITHPRIQAEVEQRFAEYERQNQPVAVYDVPLLAENDLGRSFDFVVVVHAPVEQRIQRLMQSRGMDYADAAARIKRQADDKTRLRQADYVVDNSGDVDHLREETAVLAAALRALA